MDSWGNPNTETPTPLTPLRIAATSRFFATAARPANQHCLCR